MIGETIVYDDLSPSEIYILSLINQKVETDASELQEALKDKHDWKYTTINTYLTNLSLKGYIDKIKVNRRYRYRLKRSYFDIFKNTMSRLFGDFLVSNPDCFVDYFMDLKKLKAKEETQLRKLLKTDDK